MATERKKIEIERGVPIPADRPSMYPFKDMNVGDSFFVAGAKSKSSCANGSLSYWSRKLGYRFTARTVEGGVRVWRVE